jgi:hypothetical protein
MIRYERKYTFSSHMKDGVEACLMASRYGFVRSFDDRYVNSIYMDSFDFLNYKENLAGLSKRSKARIRWYSKTPLEAVTVDTELTFEVKLRSNLVGNKLNFSFRLPNNMLNASSNILLDYLRQRVLPPELLPYIDYCSTFSLGVCYEREYYEDFTKVIRATIDKSIVFFRPAVSKVFGCKLIEKYSMEYGVVEFKFSPDEKFSLEDDIFDTIEIRAGRHSKYTVGLYLIYK